MKPQSKPVTIKDISCRLMARKCAELGMSPEATQEFMKGFSGMASEKQNTVVPEAMVPEVEKILDNAEGLLKAVFASDGNADPEEIWKRVCDGNKRE